MKSNFIKYIFILFVIFIIGFAAYKIYYKEEPLEEENQTNTIETSEQILTNMRIGVASFDNINPIISQNRDVINLSTIIYEPLMSLTEDYKLEMHLAKECSKIDEKTYVVKLKDNLKWEDGSQIIGGDVKFTIEKLQEGESIYSTNVERIDTVEIIDLLTVRINLKEQTSFFEYNLIFPIISSNQFSGEAEFFKSRVVPMSSGMYKVKSAASDSIELVKNNNWYQTADVPRKIEDIKIKFYDTMGDVYNSFKIGNMSSFQYFGTL